MRSLVAVVLACLLGLSVAVLNDPALSQLNDRFETEGRESIYFALNHTSI